MTTTATRHRLALVRPPSDDKAELAKFRDLEGQICDLERAANIAFLMWMRDEKHKGEEPLALVVIEHVERLAKELRESFYDKAVRS